MKMKVLMAMSGGIDSSVAAILLQQQGYELVGCTFCNLGTSSSAAESAAALAHTLGIAHHIVDFRSVFRREVMEPFVASYRAGQTPNPCVVCNGKIKWGALWQEAQKWGCEKIATGHYARIERVDNQTAALSEVRSPKAERYMLKRAVDRKKDQTYFLWTLPSSALENTLFPLGDYTKERVREIAREAGFEALSRQSESQEICFVPGDDYRSFLKSEGVEDMPGELVDGSGQVIGSHPGFHHFTIGQRKGLGVALGYPAFVTQIDAAHNRVTLGTREELNSCCVPLQDVRFYGDSRAPLLVQIRYRSVATPARLEGSNIHFESPVWAPTPGQSAVFYQNDCVVGGGLIASC